MRKMISFMSACLYSLEIFEMFYPSFFSGVRLLILLLSETPYI